MRTWTGSYWMMTLRGRAYCWAAAARWTMVRRLAWAPYGTQRSMMISPVHQRVHYKVINENREKSFTWSWWKSWQTLDDDRSWWDSNSCQTTNDGLWSDGQGWLWWFFTEDKWRWLRKRRSLLTDTKRWWWRWLRWTHFFDDEWLEERARTSVGMFIAKEIGENDLRLGAEPVVVEGSELWYFGCRFEQHQWRHGEWFVG